MFDNVVVSRYHSMNSLGFIKHVGPSPFKLSITFQNKNGQNVLVKDNNQSFRYNLNKNFLFYRCESITHENVMWV